MTDTTKNFDGFYANGETVTKERIQLEEWYGPYQHVAEIMCAEELENQSVGLDLCLEVCRKELNDYPAGKAISDYRLNKWVESYWGNYIDNKNAEQCNKCNREATYDIPELLCDNHWAEWYAQENKDGTNPLTHKERKQYKKEILQRIKNHSS